MWRIIHCLDNRLIDGDGVSLTRWSHSTSQKYVSASGTHLCLRLSIAQGPVLLEGLGKLIELFQLFESQTHDFPACSIVS
jgi:hypothetical protein